MGMICLEVMNRRGRKKTDDEGEVPKWKTGQKHAINKNNKEENGLDERDIYKRVDLG